jgi:hypothetical protein
MNAVHAANNAQPVQHHPSQRGMIVFGAYVIKQYERGAVPS